MIKIIAGIVSIVSCLIGAGMYLGLQAQRVSDLEEEVEKKLDKPVPEMACESYNSDAKSKLDRPETCPAGYFRFADWFYGTIENKNERWTLCCRYVTQVPHTPQ